MDAAGNPATQVIRVVNVVDTTAPTITLTAPNPVTIECSIGTYSEPGFSASDICDGNLSSSVVVAGDTVNVSMTGTYNVTYNVMDAAGNSATQVIRMVNVVDTTAPVITLTGPNPVTIECGVDTYTDPGFSAMDACDGNLTAPSSSLEILSRRERARGALTSPTMSWMWPATPQRRSSASSTLSIPLIP